MAPHFHRKGESVEAGFRRIAIEEIDAAMAAIDDSDRTSEDKVHKVRRQLKALRALLRLVRPAFPRFGKENRAFRDMARPLSAMRDAKVMLDTFDAITRRGDARPLPRSFLSVREQLGNACVSHASSEAVLGDIRSGLSAARERARHWSLEESGWAALAGGIERTYGQARCAMRHALLTGDAEASHEWRKSIKHHGAQANLLRRMKPDILKSDVKASDRLADLLGERHDIDLFLDTMARAPSRFGGIVSVTQLAGLARLRIARLDRQAERLGRKLLAHKPAAVAERWGDWWHDWRG